MEESGNSIIDCKIAVNTLKLMQKIIPKYNNALNLLKYTDVHYQTIVLANRTEMVTSYCDMQYN
jgi:hypothetical protein